MAEVREVRLPQGTIRYREAGSGPPIVFVHGYLVDGRLWDGVVDALSNRFRCIAPNWPMGAHTVAMNPDVDLSPPGVATIIEDFLVALDLDDVTLVGNDSGGAMCQVLVARRPARVGRLVLTNCDTHENFPPGISRRPGRVVGEARHHRQGDQARSRQGHPRHAQAPHPGRRGEPARLRIPVATGVGARRSLLPDGLR